MKLASVFGVYAERLQVMVDNSLDRFAATWFQNQFDWAPATNNLTYTTVIGRSRIEAAASVISRDSSTPLRSRGIMETLSGEIPALGQKFKMNQQDYRDFLTLQQLSTDDNAKKQQILDMLFSDVKKCGDSVMKRLDLFCLEAVSTGKITIDINNNPDGTVQSAQLDLGVNPNHKFNAAVDWATAATATPIKDMQDAVDYAEAEGRSIAKWLMSREAWVKMQNTTEVKDKLTGYLNLIKGTVTVTLDRVNSYLEAMNLPPIEIVNFTIGIEKDGVISTTKPFSQYNVVGVPDGKLGRIHNAFAIEQIRPVEHVNYAVFNRALISRWSQNDPFGEYTSVELNAFPALEAVDGMYYISTNKAF